MSERPRQSVADRGVCGVRQRSPVAHGGGRAFERFESIPLKIVGRTRRRRAGGDANDAILSYFAPLEGKKNSTVPPAREAPGAAPCGPWETAPGEPAAKSRALSPMFGCQVALRVPLAPFAAGVVDGVHALPGLLEIDRM